MAEDSDTHRLRREDTLQVEIKSDSEISWIHESWNLWSWKWKNVHFFTRVWLVFPNFFPKISHFWPKFLLKIYHCKFLPLFCCSKQVNLIQRHILDLGDMIFSIFSDWIDEKLDRKTEWKIMKSFHFWISNYKWRLCARIHPNISMF